MKLLLLEDSLRPCLNSRGNSFKLTAVEGARFVLSVIFESNGWVSTGYIFLFCWFVLGLQFKKCFFVPLLDNLGVRSQCFFMFLPLVLLKLSSISLFFLGL